ncbi:shikimate dehydrogenase [Stenotrophomonas aracearum]|jgi:shikimate dehydrogenase|uniref:Shikimate dehydrogenase (NADP(+)) n=1 Tax=Stenotrophomonas aracearum TaxID=3003272 RepID=A0ABY9YCI2_9GAMM|nr:shikimate dehydrogenase [Stenotrophomonas sp. A5588]WNH48565.1 shikimate dehydrogenase [Stenotrophomonas sp. A5588]
MTARYAVFGQPIAHSLSPHIHTAFARQEGIAMEYEAIEASAAEFSAVLEAFAANGGMGANVTAPLKEVAFALCRTFTSRAKLAGSVNTLLRKGDSWHGDTTDGVGLVRDLTERHLLDLRGRRVLMLGAGGSARSVAPALLDAGILELMVVNRTSERADELVDAIGEPGRAKTRRWEDLHELGDFELIVNATSAGRDPTANFVLPMSLVNSMTTAVDLNYGEAAIAFLAWARAMNCRNRVDGLGMLVEQAASSFQQWHEVRPETDPVYAELRARHVLAGAE